MSINNFTFSNMWLNSIKKRYMPSQIIKIGKLYFANIDGIYKCQHFFNFNISDDEFQIIKKFINNGKVLRFSYVDKPLFNKIKKYCDNNNVSLIVLDEWNAPKLKLSDISIKDYLMNMCGTQTIRNYKKYRKTIDGYQYIDSSFGNVDKLWKDTLYIDTHSWKAREHSDMYSLNREDIQYELFLKQNRNESFLNVIYKEEIPLAYSLMFKNFSDNKWYAVKWGASDVGRKYYAGLFCLYNSLEKVTKNKKNLIMDFWGRRSSTYDLLKNYDEKRYHILLERGKIDEFKTDKFR